MKIEALNEIIGRWETTWFTFIYCILSVLIWWGTVSITYESSANLWATPCTQVLLTKGTKSSYMIG